MLPTPPWNELRRRLPRLVLGLVLFGLGLALMVVADLGLAPWEVLHQGISRWTGIPIGTVGIITGFIVLLFWIPLKERIGFGTIANVLIIGVVIDLTLLVMDEPFQGLLQWGVLAGAMLLIAAGSGLYIGVELGPGPRDGLMTGIARRGYPIWLVRAAIEISVLISGWLLGGTVGIGTVVFAFGIGPLVQLALSRLSLTVRPKGSSA